MVWMKKTKDGAHNLTHHGKPIKVGAVLDVERAFVGRYKDAGFTEITAENLQLNEAAESNKKADKITRTKKTFLSLEDIAPNEEAKGKLRDLVKKAKKGRE